MSPLRDVLSRRNERDAGKLVADALKALDDRSWRPEAELRKLRQVKEILGAPDERRRACVLEVARRRDSYDCVRLLSLIARKRVDLTAEEIE